MTIDGRQHEHRRPGRPRHRRQHHRLEPGVRHVAAVAARARSEHEGRLHAQLVRRRADGDRVGHGARGELPRQRRPQLRTPGGLQHRARRPLRRPPESPQPELRRHQLPRDAGAHRVPRPAASAEQALSAAVSRDRCPTRSARRWTTGSDVQVGGLPVDARNLDLEWGPSDFDVRHRLVVNWLWELPFLRDAGGVAGALLGGWQINGITAAAERLPVQRHHQRAVPGGRLQRRRRQQRSAEPAVVRPRAARHQQGRIHQRPVRRGGFPAAGRARHPAAQRLSRPRLRQHRPLDLQGLPCCRRAPRSSSAPRCSMCSTGSTCSVPTATSRRRTFGRVDAVVPRARAPVRAQVHLLKRFLIVLCSIAALRVRLEAPSAPRSMIVITIDTLRADHVTPAVAPALARLALQAMSFEAAVTVAPLTLPSHASLLTASYPPAHGVRDNHIFSLPSGTATYASRLQAIAAMRPRRSSAPSSSTAASASTRGSTSMTTRSAANRSGARRRRSRGRASGWPRAPARGRSSCGCTSSSRTRRTSPAATPREVTGLDRELDALLLDAARARALGRHWCSRSPPTTANRSASTASRRTASSSTTRRCASRGSSRRRACAGPLPAPGAHRRRDADDGVAGRRRRCEPLRRSRRRGPPARSSRTATRRALEAYCETLPAAASVQLERAAVAPHRARSSTSTAPRPELYDLADDPAEQHNVIAERRADAAADAEDHRRASTARRPARGPPRRGRRQPRTRSSLALGYIGYAPAARSAADAALADPKDKLDVYRLVDVRAGAARKRASRTRRSPRWRARRGWTRPSRRCTTCTA